MEGEGSTHTSMDPQFASFLHHVRAKRYKYALENLEYALFARDAGILCKTRNHYGQLLRTAAFDIMKSSSDIDASEKASLLQFLWSCFVCTHDLESQLVIRYEILLLQESIKNMGHQTHDLAWEWVTFARDCLATGFIATAVKVYEIAIQHMKLIQNSERLPLDMQNLLVQAIEENSLAKLWDAGKTGTAQLEISEPPSTVHGLKHAVVDRRETASSSYRNGLKKKNEHKLQLHKLGSGS